MELSSVKLIMADGGNKADGVCKAKKARIPLCEILEEASPSSSPRGLV